MSFSRYTAQHFWRLVDKVHMVYPVCGQCWIWCGSRNKQGYGRFSYYDEDGEREQQAHRISWILHFGSIEGLDILHRCDIPQCVNPEHLYKGTDLDNSKDKIDRERQAKLKGEANGRAVLTDDLVKEIRQIFTRLSCSENRRCIALAKSYGLSRNAIYNLVHRKSWSHIL